MGDIADIAGVVISGAKLLESNVVKAMGRAHALPRSVVSDPDLLRDWQSNRQIGFRWYSSSPLADVGLGTATDFTVLVNWDFGGHMNGAGRFIKDAYAYVSVAGIGETYRYDVSCDFDMPSYTGAAASPTAYIEGRIEVTANRTLTGFQWSRSRHFTIRGDGSGEIGGWV